ncbi:glycosyl hydrolase family 43, partial [Flavobacterium sp. F-30]|nr:glycosyl hydrolase family 43 [Flavobacterium sp. F-30]
GDRWSYPKQGSAATYVWQPFVISGTSVSMPKYQEAWQINLSTGIASALENKGIVLKNTDKQIQYKGNWKHTDSESKSDEKEASFSIKFNGRQTTLYSFSGPENGYAKVVLADENGRNILTNTIDMYSKFSIEGPVFRSPILKKGNYILTVYNTEERPNWSDKKKTNYGSTGNYISVSQISIEGGSK